MKQPVLVSQQMIVPQGFRFAGIAAGIKKNGQPDLAMAEIAAGAQAAAVFTSNLVVAAPIEVGRAHLKRSRGQVRAVIVNSGNANCATGAAGLRACERVCRELATHLAIAPNEVFPSSTGVIGMPLQAEKIVAALPALASALQSSPEGLGQFGRAIMTTDTRRKVASTRFRCGRESATMVGMAKGSGMIHPNMATMLAYIFTDVALPPRELRAALVAACAKSFNSISVDGDTSTNDTVLLLASGVAGRAASSADRQRFRAALDGVCASLAEQIVRDGEGVQHVVRLHIEEARSVEEGLRIAQTVATSPLVKTAWTGADPNWGRILAAVGRAGIKLAPQRISIFFGEQLVCRNGVAVEFDEPQAHALMSQPAYDITIRLGRGRASTTLLTCDLTAEYVRINADYRS
jgi:glutamate N-acetyltransferase / amino-acid N-acetyltransferase